MKQRFFSSNAFDIPDLLPQASCPLGDRAVPWGSIRRRGAMRGTWLFYVDDYRFEGLWKNPAAPLGTAPCSLVEANWTIFPDSPTAEVIWQLYRKRWLSRYWQAMGTPVWVDLNVPLEHERWTLIGVPPGWRHYATVASPKRLPDLRRDWEIAGEHAGGAFELLVYGGGSAVREACEGLPGATHIAHRTAGTEKTGESARRRARGW